MARAEPAEIAAVAAHVAGVLKFDKYSRYDPQLSAREFVILQHFVHSRKVELAGARLAMMCAYMIYAQGGVSEVNEAYSDLRSLLFPHLRNLYNPADITERYEQATGIKVNSPEFLEAERYAEQYIEKLQAEQQARG